MAYDRPRVFKKNEKREDNKIVKKHWSTLISQLGETLNIPELEFSEDDSCSLGFDELVVRLCFRESKDDFMFYSDLGILPAQPLVDHLIALLEANCLQRNTDGGAIGIVYDEERHIYVIALSRIISDEHYGYTEFEESLYRFVEIADYWTKKISSWAEGSQTPESSKEDINTEYDPLLHKLRA